MAKGRTIRLHLVDGLPGGVVTAEIMNWTGHVLSGPRSLLPDLLKRREAARTGVYLLTGPDPDAPSRQAAYVGESDNVAKRLAQHSKDEDKDWWDHAFLVTSKDQNLTKAHVRFLESRLIGIAKKAGRVQLANGTAPDYGYLPEADVSDMEFFIEQVRIVLPVLGLDLLREQPAVTGGQVTQPGAPLPTASPTFELIAKKHNLHALARQVGGDFVVLAGSQARPKWESQGVHTYAGLHKELIEGGRIVADPIAGTAKFAEDHSFPSPSAAAAAVLGRPDNGRKSWRVQGTGQTYGDWQNEQVDTAVGGSAQD